MASLDYVLAGLEYRPSKIEEFIPGLIKDKMEQKQKKVTMINIAEILKSFSIGTILYSPICGELRLGKIISNCIFCNTDTGQSIVFMEDGTLKSYGKWGNKGECILFPSQFMNDWEKLTWKKGDILVQNDYHCIFEEFTGQNFCSFKQKYIDYEGAKDIQTTANWFKSNDENVNRQYIREIEEKYGGKLNLDTLEIEKKV